MALDANSYGTVVMVEHRVGDQVDGRKFTASTFPTKAAVESFIDDRSDDLNNCLKLNGYTVPVAVGTDPEAHGILSKAAASGAALDVLNSFPSESFDPEGADPLANRKASLWEEFDRAMKACASQGLSAAQSLTTLAPYSGSLEDADGNTKKPLMTRDMDAPTGVYDFVEST